jgi:hypothetical protein
MKPLLSPVTHTFLNQAVAEREVLTQHDSFSGGGFSGSSEASQFGAAECFRA